jgi:O-acetyl-ADP-ribose deacetylase (regulator of RNase III)
MLDRRDVVPDRVIELAVGDITRHVAFPSISTGALGYPQFQAALAKVADAPGGGA